MIHYYISIALMLLLSCTACSSSDPMDGEETVDNHEVTCTESYTSERLAWLFAHTRKQ